MKKTQILTIYYLIISLFIFNVIASKLIDVKAQINNKIKIADLTKKREELANEYTKLSINLSEIYSLSSIKNSKQIESYTPINETLVVKENNTIAIRTQ